MCAQSLVRPLAAQSLYLYSGRKVARLAECVRAEPSLANRVVSLAFAVLAKETSTKDQLAEILRHATSLRNLSGEFLPGATAFEEFASVTGSTLETIRHLGVDARPVSAATFSLFTKLRELHV